MKERYFAWLCAKFGRTGHSRAKLLRLLHAISYSWVIPMDGDREADGSDLRYHFALNQHLEPAAVASELDTRPCSVLEMLVALAIRMESIMCDPEKGDRTELWLREMLDNLGLLTMTDAHYCEPAARRRLDIFMSNSYERNGRGGLFSFARPRQDMRRTDIWTQAMWHLTEVYYGRDADMA